ncbi:hypothetical protein BLS_008813 [Venturia inaequalis]|uniref:Calcofluor white hypersensitive protein n=1 Tax=Venturia inaequalis TaxID=5025 RepID=A0A8H3V369_VENIN|nr:hypothetical protein BLS_008813 [Venturia inaequalis]KAE9985881.1 hypothetical protein EG327_004523 [Venturia inaequalis]RDI80307.1 hypothetical protein Vi05172_g9765 [Venturia inaequalis]
MSRALKLAGGVAAAGAGYYLYQSGGSPKVAEKQFEHDAAKLSSKVRSELPGRENEATTQLKLSGEQAGKTIDSAFQQAKDATTRADKSLQSYAASAEKKLGEIKEETGKNLTAGIDKFDKNVSKGAAESKSWLGSWFGGK